MLDETHDPSLRSWVGSANLPDTDFPVQNLPYGVFRQQGDVFGRIGTAIGDQILDLRQVAEQGLLCGTGEACRADSLNGLMAEPAESRRALRRSLSGLLSASAPESLRSAAATCLLPIASARMQLPARIGDFSDFFASINHATNVGRLFRPNDPLLPNYKWVPIAYHGRSSSVRVSGEPVRRPSGQTRHGQCAQPVFGRSRQLDYEAELGLFVGPGNTLGQPIPIGEAWRHLFGAVLLNDWSARDIQAWEYQPLGPFLAKSFSTTISPWVVSVEALAPFRVPASWRPLGDPAPLPYLSDPEDQASGGVNLRIEIAIQTAAMRTAGDLPFPLSAVRFATMYWTPAQLVAHHASNGCNLCSGDLIGSGTISDGNTGAVGSLLELTRGGKAPVMLPNVESRAFVEDGDEIIMRGWCEREGFVRIGFGECRALVSPSSLQAHSPSRG